MADVLPSVLFVSCTNEGPETLIKLLLGELPKGICNEGITMYDWHINNKYYEADVKLCAAVEKGLSSPEFASSVEGVIIFFDPQSPRGFEPVNEWKCFLDEYEAEVKILVCNRCPETSETILSKLKVQEWCVKEGFELVELHPIVDEEWENEQDFIETSGIDRVVQALEAHVWPNLILKERKDPTTMAGLLHGGFCKSSVTDHDGWPPRINSDVSPAHSLEEKGENSQERENYAYSDEVPCSTTHLRRPQDHIQPSIGELLSDENADFCDLFSQLPLMKERASTMPNEQRKKFAEDVVLAYWKAIGGDKDEILDC